MKKLFDDKRLPCLFVMDDQGLLTDLKSHLATDFADYQVAMTITEAEEICKKEHPHIILIGAKTLSKSEHIYLNIIKKVKGLQNHRAVLMVCATDAGRAYELCKDEVFNDYVIVNPLYDHQVFNAAIMRSVEVLRKNLDLRGS